MPEFVPQCRLAIVLFSCVMLCAACVAQAPAPAVASASSVERGRVCKASQNLAVCFFASAHPQGDGEAETLRTALHDALTVPLETLRAKRYPDAEGRPDKWTFEQVIGSVFTGVAWRAVESGAEVEGVGTGTAGFIEAIKAPEAIPVLKQLLKELEEFIQQYESKSTE